MTMGLAALGLIAVLALIVLFAFPEVRSTIGRMFLGTILFLLGVAVLGLLLITFTGWDPEPLVRSTALQMTQDLLVDFHALLPEQYRVQLVAHEDSDGDAQNEWLVFYQFDLADGSSPYAGVIYDSDRGDPPILYPYRLAPPDRDYLGEENIGYQFKDIVDLGEGTTPVKELFVYGTACNIIEPKNAGEMCESSDLTIFRHFPNTLPWEPPTDDPRRYSVIGAFRGDGGVTFDWNTKDVTVVNRVQDRSQLAVKTVYAMDAERGTYMSLFDPTQLSAPVSSKVTFAFGMPDDLLDTPYAEKIVLGFYEMLGERKPPIPPTDFLTGEALIQYQQNNLDYFGFQDASGTFADVSDVMVTELKYAPEVERFTDIAVQDTNATPDLTTPESGPRNLVVSVAFGSQVKGAAFQTPEPIVWVTVNKNGKWKIEHRS